VPSLAGGRLPRSRGAHAGSIRRGRGDQVEGAYLPALATVRPVLITSAALLGGLVNFPVARLRAKVREVSGTLRVFGVTTAFRWSSGRGAPRSRSTPAALSCRRASPAISSGITTCRLPPCWFDRWFDGLFLAGLAVLTSL